MGSKEKRERSWTAYLLKFGAESEFEEVYYKLKIAFHRTGSKALEAVYSDKRI